jgi:hypothetical protein
MNDWQLPFPEDPRFSLPLIWAVSLTRSEREHVNIREAHKFSQAFIRLQISHPGSREGTCVLVKELNHFKRLKPKTENSTTVLYLFKNGIIWFEWILRQVTIKPEYLLHTRCMSILCVYVLLWIIFFAWSDISCIDAEERTNTARVGCGNHLNVNSVTKNKRFELWIRDSAASYVSEHECCSGYGIFEDKIERKEVLGVLHWHYIILSKELLENCQIV